MVDGHPSLGKIVVLGPAVQLVAEIVRCNSGAAADRGLEGLVEVVVVLGTGDEVADPELSLKLGEGRDGACQSCQCKCVENVEGSVNLPREGRTKPM